MASKKKKAAKKATGRKLKKKWVVLPGFLKKQREGG